MQFPFGARDEIEPVSKEHDIHLDLVRAGSIGGWAGLFRVENIHRGKRNEAGKAERSMIAALHFSRHKSLGVTIRTNSLFHRKYGLGAPWRFAVLICVFALCSSSASNASAVAEEFIGKFEPKLAPNKDDLDHVIFKPFRDLSKVQFAKRPESDATITAGRLYHPPTDKAAILALLVEPEGEPPYVLADIDLNNTMDANEKFDLSNAESGNPYIWQTTVNVPLKEGFFQSFPIFVQYFKNVEMDEMGKDDRLILQSTKAFARGYVDIQGKKTLVQYDHNPRNKKINPMNCALGVDGDGDGEIDMDYFSPEAAEAHEEVVVFRVGDNYVSTKRADLEKNQIIMRSHSAGEYKRVELKMGGVVPDFQFTDFQARSAAFRNSVANTC